MTNNPVRCLVKRLMYYSNINMQCCLLAPFESLIDLVKINFVRGQAMLDKSADRKIKEVKVQLNQSGRWSVQRTIDDARSRIIQKKLIGTMRQGKRGLYVTGSKSRPMKTRTKEGKTSRERLGKLKSNEDQKQWQWIHKGYGLGGMSPLRN